MIQLLKSWISHDGIFKKVSVFILLFIIFHAAPSKGADIAYIFQAEDLGRQGYWVNSPRFVYEVVRYSYSGYKIRILPATEDNILDALVDPETKAMTLFAHGGFGGTTPTVLKSTALDWRRIVRKFLEEKYTFEGLSADEAKLRALQESQNFGLESFTNYSCSSLAKNDIADLFVKPGGIYHGVKKSYSPGPIGPFFKDSEVLLTEYRVNIQPSWGPGIPDNKEPEFFIVWPPYGGGCNGYRDGNKIWIWTNNWHKYLVHNGDGFLEFTKDNPGKAIALYDRDRDEHGKVIEHVDSEGKRRWTGPVKNPSNDSVGRYYIVWEQ